MQFELRVNNISLCVNLSETTKANERENSTIRLINDALIETSTHIYIRIDLSSSISIYLSRSISLNMIKNKSPHAFIWRTLEATFISAQIYLGFLSMRAANQTTFF